MSLKQRTISPALPDAEEARPAGKGQRRVGLALVMIGIVLISLAAKDALASTGDGSDTSDALRGSGSAERLDGYAGNDLINGFAGDDALSGGDGADEVYGGPGRDILFGGAGDDFIEAKDGGADYVDCGAGDDVASVDDNDRGSSGCETVYPG